MRGHCAGISDSENRNLTAFARYDSANRIVSSSVVLRTKKPSGNFKEVPGYLCCNPIIVVSATPTGTYVTTTTVTIGCGDNRLYSLVSASDLSVADIVAELIAFPSIGTFTDGGTAVVLTSPICEDATFTITKS